MLQLVREVRTRRATAVLQRHHMMNINLLFRYCLRKNDDAGSSNYPGSPASGTHCPPALNQ